MTISSELVCCTNLTAWRTILIHKQILMVYLSSCSEICANLLISNFSRENLQLKKSSKKMKSTKMISQKETKKLSLEKVLWLRPIKRKCLPTFKKRKQVKIESSIRYRQKKLKRSVLLSIKRGSRSYLAKQTLLHKRSDQRVHKSFLQRNKEFISQQRPKIWKWRSKFLFFR